MQENVDFKTGLLYFYWMMAGADGNRSFEPNDPEWIMMQKMCRYENIPDEMLQTFIQSDLGNESEQFEKILFSLVIANHRDRVRALAWMDLIMYADGEIHQGEEMLFTRVRRKFEIDEYEINIIKQHLLQAIE